jgi:hypothetical protein
VPGLRQNADVDAMMVTSIPARTKMTAAAIRMACTDDMLAPRTACVMFLSVAAPPSVKTRNEEKKKKKNWGE